MSHIAFPSLHVHLAIINLLTDELEKTKEMASNHHLVPETKPEKRALLWKTLPGLVSPQRMVLATLPVKLLHCGSKLYENDAFNS